MENEKESSKLRERERERERERADQNGWVGRSRKIGARRPAPSRAAPGRSGRCSYQMWMDPTDNSDDMFIRLAARLATFHHFLR